MSKDNLPYKDTNKGYHFPSLDLIFELTKDYAARQREQSGSLDSKANFVLGAATTLVSAGLVLQAVLLATPKTLLHPPLSVLLSYCSEPLNDFLRLLPLLILLAVYLMTMLAAFLAYKLREYQDVPNPDELYRSYLHTEENTTKAEVFRAMLAASKSNNRVIGKKLRWLRIAFGTLGCEVVALAFVLLAQMIC